MAEYEQRERAFNQSLPGIFSNYAKGLVIADGEAKMQYLEFIKGVLAEPNITMEQKVSIINSKNPMTVGVSLPVASVVDISPFGIEKATIKCSMDVSASQVAESKTDIASEAEGSGTVGWGFIKAKVRVKASVAKHSSSKRSSDYRATTDAEMVMSRVQPPETLMRVMDMFAEVTEETMQINREIISRQAALAREEVVANPGLVASTDDYAEAA